MFLNVLKILEKDKTKATNVLFWDEYWGVDIIKLENVYFLMNPTIIFGIPFL